VSAAAFASALAASAACAQSVEPAAEEAVEIGEIVVTAQKRAERLQDVPLAVSAVTGDALANRQINDTASLVNAVPSLTFTQGANPTNSAFRIRGVGTALFGQGVESSVSAVVDGVVMARQAQGFEDFADIERVEVLRGPQGTLFGKNASAGVISIVTARPSNDFEGRVEATIAEHDEYRLKGTVSGPLGDTLRARVTGFYNDVKGPTRNVTTGRWVNGQESWGLRGKLEWDPTDELNLLFSAEYRKTDALCCASTLIAAVNPIIAQLHAPVVASRSNRQIPEDTETTAASNQTVVSLEGNLDLGFATVTSITAYQHYRLDVNQPIDRIDSDPVVFVGAAAPYSSWPYNRGILDVDAFSQELRIANKGGGDLTYVAGLYFNDSWIDRPFERRRSKCNTGVIGQPCTTAPVFQSQGSLAKLHTSSVAAFGQGELRLVGGLKAIGGLRIQYEEGHNRGYQLGVLVPGDTLLAGAPPISEGAASSHDTAVTGKAGLQYEFSRNAQAYATYTRGYKGEGYNMEAGTDFRTQTVLKPEHVDAYEVGFKGRMFEGMLSLAAAAFLADYDNLQVQTNRSDPVTGVTAFVATNAGSSRAKGVELEATFRPARWFSMDAGVTYSDAKFDLAGLNCPLQFQAAAPVIAGAAPANSCYRPAPGATPRQDIEGGRLPASPKWRISLAPRVEIDLNEDLAVFGQASVSYQSAQNFSVEQDPLLEQEAYTLVDLSLGLRQIGGRYSVSLFVKNLFDENYFTSIGHNSLLATPASPFDLVATYNKDSRRYFGVNLGYRF
jgi:iron complex outermembrane recepter protein